jgi:hypothetical protein
MKRHATKEAFYQRLQELAEVNKPALKESKNRNLGTLIDYKRAADGVAYGIIKEQHHYYVKKAGTKQDPNIADFAYIGGLENVTNFQYKSLGEADKQRNMIFHTINEAVSLKPSKTGSKEKKRLNEDKAGEEIDNAESKLGDLDAATSAEATPEMPVDTEVPIEPVPEEGGGEEIPSEEPAPEESGEEMPSEVPAPEGGGEEEPAPEEGGEEMPSEEPAPEEPTSDAVAPEDEKSITIKEIEKSLGKVTNKIRGTELTDSQVKSYVNSFLTAFKDKFEDVEIEDRKIMADKILKVVPDEDVENLSANVSQDNEEIEEEQCSECGGFGKYAESRGYNTPESFMESDSEEQANVVNGYVSAHEEGMNDGDEKTISLIIKLSPDVLDKLKGDYGHEEYAEKIQPQVDSMNEATEEDSMAQLNELWGGLRSLGKAAGQAIGGAVKGAGQAVSGAVKGAGQAIGKAYQGAKQTYYKGEINPAVKKVEADAATLGKQIANLNATLTKAGQQPINVKSILATIQNQLGAGATQANLSKFRTAAEGFDPANVEVQPNILKEDDEPLDVEKGEEIEGGEEIENGIDNKKPEIGFATDAQVLGGGVVKPDGAPTTTVDVNVDAQNKTVNVAMNETEQKLRKYIRNRLEEKAGLRKSNLTENKKSETLKKLDGVIDEQFKLYESVVSKKSK